MGQNRVFYACQAVGMAGTFGSEKYIEGVQSVGVNTTFDFEQAFELGVLTIYENMEGVPSVEVTMERNLVSGVYPLWNTISRIGRTKNGLNDSNVPSEQVLGVGEARPSVVLQVYQENTTLANSNATPTYSVLMSGMYLSNYSLNVGVDGPATESLTLTGNDYRWVKGASHLLTGGPATTTGLTSASGLVLKRQDVNRLLVANVIPPSGYISGSGLQSISVSIDFGREDIFELGLKTPYYKSPTYPVEVSTEIEFIETNTVTRDYGSLNFTDSTTTDVTKNAVLGFSIGDFGVFMGSGNRLTGTSTTGGDAGGGNSTITFSYQTFNELAIGARAAATVKHYNKNHSGDHMS